MNNIDPPSPPPLLPPLNPALAPPDEDPDDALPVSSLVMAAEAVLRQPRRLMLQLRRPGAGGLTARMLVVSLACSLGYGVVVGTFSMGAQLWVAPVKVAGGLFAAALICLPSLYIFSCLGGSQARLAEVAGLVAGSLMLMTILLIGFAPVAWLFSTSTESVNWMGTLHLVLWGMAAIFGLRFLEAGFCNGQVRSSAGFNTWAIMFVLVALQMTTALRPIVGTSDRFLQTEKKFFGSYWGECLQTSLPGPSR